VTPIEHYRPEAIGFFEAYGRNNPRPLFLEGAVELYSIFAASLVVVVCLKFPERGWLGRRLAGIATLRLG
jgi:hypothetical protein